MGSRRRVFHSIIDLLDGRWGISERIKAGLFAIAVAGVIIGISGLATIASQQVNKPTLVSAVTSSTKKPPSLTAISSPPQKEKPTLAIAEQPILKAADNIKPKTTSSIAAKTSPSVRCTAQQLHAIRQTKGKAVAEESRRHKRMLRSFQGTSLLTRFFNPGEYSYRQTREATNHKKALATAEKQFSQSLKRAQCAV